MSAMYQIEKVVEKNRDSGCVQIRSVLVHAELWTVSLGVKEEAVPEGVDWTGLHQKALATIILSVRPSQLGYVKHCAYAFEAWMRFKEVHQQW